MSNAVKFTDKGHVELAISAEITSLTQCRLEFSVRDTGIGINKKQQDTIFEPFAQEDSSTTRKFGGTGLGLAISTQLVELMGGKIQLDSDKKVGSRFYFSLQLEINYTDYVKPTDKMLPIYVISDDSELLRTITNELAFYGRNVEQHYPSVAQFSKSQPHATACIVLYIESKPDNAQQFEAHFAQLQTNGIQVCLVRAFLSGIHDFSTNVSAIVSHPFYGQRLLKSLDNCTPKKYVNVSSSQPSNIIKKRILIVEDNTVNQKIAGLHLNKYGFEYDIANNGLEAFQMYTTKPNDYAVILMDCMMPVMDGFEATTKIRHFEQNTKQRIPIIALTASVIDDDIQRCFDVGMDDYVAKPFRASMLTEKIETMSAVYIEQKNESTKSVNTLDTLTTGGSLRPHERTERILLVEDNRVNQKVASLMLDKAGFNYKIVENGQIAIDTYTQDSSFDVILMDCMMPVKDGFEATREIRHHELELGLSKTPIIALTASVIDDDIQRCFESGMDAYVAKPVRKDHLIEKIESMISI